MTGLPFVLRSSFHCLCTPPSRLLLVCSLLSNQLFCSYFLVILSQSSPFPLPLFFSSPPSASPLSSSPLITSNFLPFHLLRSLVLISPIYLSLCSSFPSSSALSVFWENISFSLVRPSFYWFYWQHFSQSFRLFIEGKAEMELIALKAALFDLSVSGNQEPFPVVASTTL